MTEKEAIKKHIDECQHRIKIIQGFTESNKDADIDACTGNIHALEEAIQALTEIQQYREIGTVDKCRAAVKRMKPEEPLGGQDIEGNEYLICRKCCGIVQDGDWYADYCPDCGQAVEWGGKQ